MIRPVTRTESDPHALPPPLPNRRARSARVRQVMMAVSFIFPALFFAAVFDYFPALSALYHAFFNWNGYNAPIFNGIENFVNLFKDPLVHLAAAHVGLLAAWGIIVELTVPLFVARIIYGLRSRKSQFFFRLIFVIPLVVPVVVTALIWTFFYNPVVGIIDHLLRMMGFKQLALAWLANPHTALFAIMFMGFPWVDGFGMLIYSAGFQAIPSEILEAAALDGATKVRRFFSIELPLILGQIRLMLILTIINTLSVFTPIMIMTDGGPGNATTVPSLLIYQDAFLNSEFGYASAIAFMLFLVMLLLTILNVRVLRSATEYQSS